MIRIRKAEERGHADHGWLDTWHTFSFADYHDPRHMGFRVLRVINEDFVAPGQGFATHGHRDMEILTYVLDGAVRHRDSMGNGSLIRPGEVQRMSAGTGVTHSEVNPSPADPLHFLQVWILPERKDLPPGYEQRAFPAAERRNRLRLVASRDGRDGALRIHQDVDLYAALLDQDAEVRLALRPGRHAWLQLARGEVELNGVGMRAGDGAQVSEEVEARVLGRAAPAAELLLFDLP